MTRLTTEQIEQDDRRMATKLAAARKFEQSRGEYCAECGEPTDGADVWTRDALVVHARCVDFEKVVRDGILTGDSVTDFGENALVLECWGESVRYLRGPYASMSEVVAGAAREMERRGRRQNEERRRVFFSGREAPAAPDVHAMLQDMIVRVAYRTEDRT